MQIKVDKENISPLKDLAESNRRSPTGEANAAISLHLYENFRHIEEFRKKRGLSPKRKKHARSR